jgi:hypothetical protein
MKTQSSFTIQSVSLFGRVSRAKCNEFPFGANQSLIPLTPKVNAPESTLIWCVFFLVSVVFAGCHNSEVMTAVVQGVMVSVVTAPLISSFQSKNFSVHQPENSIGAITSRVKAFGKWCPKRVPVILGKFFKINLIYQSYLALGERNFAVRCGRGHGRSLGGWACPVLMHLTPSFYHRAGVAA